MDTSKKHIPGLNFLIHLFCWVLGLQLVFNFEGLYYSFVALFIDHEPYVDEAFLLIPIMLILFYTNSHFLAPKLLRKQRVLLYLLSVIGLIAAFVGVGFLIFTLLTRQGYDLRTDDIGMFDQLFFIGVLVTGLSTSIGLIGVLRENTRQKKKAEQERKKAELMYLSEQVNPHFLFNTLNTLYSLSTEENAPQTTEAILKLSEIMRYPISEGKQPEVDLEREIKFISDYIDLQRLRLGDDYPIHFSITGSEAGKKVAPFLFIPIVENAFKYGVSRKVSRPIHIELKIASEKVNLKVTNSIVASDDKVSEKFGLKNLKERLALLYREGYELSIRSDDTTFEVNLSVPFSAG